MKKLLIAIMCISVLLGFIGTVSAVTVGNAVIDRSEFDGATNIAFIDPTLVFTSDGILTSWSFWAEVPADGEGAFNTQVYRYTGTDDDWELVYQDEFTNIGEPGVGGSWTLDASTAFNVQAGDVVGWWFGEDGGIIPYDYIGADDVEWTNYLATAIVDPTVGDIYSFNTGDWARSSQQREYSISAEYTPVPEPATILLICSGLIGLAGLRRKLIQK